MQFLIRAYDGEGKLDKRMEVRPRHLEGMKKLNAHIISAGGLLDDEGKMKDGYNRGTSLRSMIYDWYRYEPKVKRIIPGDNPGITVLVLKELF
jgi:hypothetical protein